MDQQTELRLVIAAIRQRWFRLVALRTVGRALAVASVPVFVAVCLEYLFAPKAGALVWLVVAAVVASLACVGVIVWRMQRRPDDRHVARFIEERAAALPDGQGLSDALVSAVDVAAVPGADRQPAFAPLLIDAAVRRLREIAPSAIISPSAIRQAAGQALGGAVCLTVAVGLGAPGLDRAITTARARYFPRSIAVEVTPGHARVAAGTPLRIRATLRDGGVALTALAPSMTVAAGGETRTVEMTRAGDGFEYAFESIDRSFEYTVAAGQATSGRFAITALVPPVVRSIDVRYAFPSFTGLPPRDDRDGGDIYAPAGTHVRLRIHTDKPATAGEMALRGTALPLREAGDRVFEVDMVLRADDAYRVRLADADGLRSTSETEYFIRVMDDRPPDVRILRPSSDQQITALEEVAIEARADDDYEIAAFDLVYSVSGGRERTVAFDRVTGTDVQRVGSRLVPAEELAVRPGDVIAYYARARDVGRGRRSKETRSDIFFLEVTPFTEEFVAAQSQAGGAAAAQVDSLIDAQKAIISATWNIERRSEAGRSIDDMKAVAQAQADLKARAEQLSSRGGRGRGRGFIPQRLSPQVVVPPRAGSADPIAAAVDAMTKALQQLEGQKTRDAIPHEMAALNGLLQAQAEIRRRQVSQSMAGGGGGGNRVGQDLSALFDKELQRQQRTNYEDRSQVEARPDQPPPGGDIADRLRDLARRQEDLSQRQRDLAAARPDLEEMKRQLEKLTREQTELREQLEQLDRQMPRGPEGPPSQGRSGQQGSQGSQGGQPAAGRSGRGGQGQGAGAQAGGEMREASEQMREASSDLRREDPNAAAGAAERAAQQLRRLEQQMRGGAAAGASADGDLRVQAQQIAEEQRRIAAEAARLEPGRGHAVAEASKRLAADKDRLAGRVDDLQRSAEAASRRNSGATDMAHAGDAARQLSQGRIGQRMREGAAGMRQGTSDDRRSAAGAEEQLARDLDRVVDTLGGSQSAEARELSDTLGQTRELRDRLNRAERQLREAEARQASGMESGRESQGRAGAPASRGGATSGRAGQAGEVERLRQEYQRELQRAREALGRLGAGGQQAGAGGATPEQHEFSRSAPGTERFKQDRSSWESLRKDFDVALEKYEASASDRLARPTTDDRFSAGGSERVPDHYRRLIARYYQALAKARK